MYPIAFLDKSEDFEGTWVTNEFFLIEIFYPFVEIYKEIESRNKLLDMWFVLLLYVKTIFMIGIEGKYLPTRPDGGLHVIV